MEVVEDAWSGGMLRGAGQKLARHYAAHMMVERTPLL